MRLPAHDDFATTNQKPRDALGRITRRTETAPVVRTVSYMYDERGRLETVSDGAAETQYIYDANGNRLSKLSSPGGETAGTYDEHDRLTTYGDLEFSYGENGELETKTDTVAEETTSYVYDARGSLRSVTLPDATSIEYVIDGRGRRVGKKVNSALVQGFLYRDQLRIAAELDGSGAIVARFAYVGGSHSPDWMQKGGNLYRFVKDQVGSVRLVVDVQTGTVAQQLDYDEFGFVQNDSNPGFQPFGFAGGLYDGDTVLTRFGARDYDAEVGRWTSKDPIIWAGRQSNLYVYSLNDPVNFIDITGRGWQGVAGALLVGGGALGIRYGWGGPLAGVAFGVGVALTAWELYDSYVQAPLDEIDRADRMIDPIRDRRRRDEDVLKDLDEHDPDKKESERDICDEE